MGLKEDYEATGQGEYVKQGLPEFRADNLGKKATKKEAGPEDYSREASAWRKRSKVCRDLLDENITPYLSRWEGEGREEFKTRKAASVYGFVNFYEEAVNGLVDQVFKRNIQWGPEEDQSLPADDEQRINVFLDNVTLSKRSPMSVTSFLRNAAERSLGIGGTPIILIDHPERSEAANDKAEEDAQGLSPYFHLIDPEQIIDVIEDDDGNVRQFRYFSTQEIPSGEWGRESVSVIVILDRGEVGGYATRRVLVFDEKKEAYIEDEDQFREFVPPDTASAQIKAKFREIPVVGIPTGAHGWFCRPMLRNVAHLNVLHYRKRTDYDVAESVASVPMSAWFGWSDTDLAAQSWGPFRRAHTSKSPQDADIKDVSFKFETAKISLATLESIERYIAVKSKDPQSQRATGEEKSTIRMLDEGKKISRLQAWALGWLNSMQAALAWAGYWMGMESVGELSYLDEVFDALDASPGWAEFIQLASMVELPLNVLIDEAQRYGVLSDKWDAQALAEDVLGSVGGVED